MVEAFSGDWYFRWCLRREWSRKRRWMVDKRYRTHTYESTTRNENNFRWCPGFEGAPVFTEISDKISEDGEAQTGRNFFNSTSGESWKMDEPEFQFRENGGAVSAGRGQRKDCGLHDGNSGIDETASNQHLWAVLGERAMDGHPQLEPGSVVWPQACNVGVIC